MDVIDRFVTKVALGDECWVWTAGSNSNGYGNFAADSGRFVGAHRFAYETFVGAIAPGFVLDHLCRNRLCVNPDHLEPVSNRDNILRGVSPSAAAAKKTHCPNGHPYDEANTYLDSRGFRHCRACAYKRQASARARRSEKERAEYNARARARNAADPARIAAKNERRRQRAAQIRTALEVARQPVG